MTQTDIVEKLKELTAADRLAVAEAALRLIREDLQETREPTAAQERKQQLTKAAEALLPDYKARGELTAFTSLDSEDFCAKG
ncbi:MAG: hypothetical protein HYY81_04230 [Deltaproteobacteria bacterium]|nr:hypothetical protein [Deltaproteobacteria bacterium]